MVSEFQLSEIWYDAWSRLLQPEWLPLLNMRPFPVDQRAPKPRDLTARRLDSAWLYPLLRILFTYIFEGVLSLKLPVTSCTEFLGKINGFKAACGDEYSLLAGLDCPYSFGVSPLFLTHVASQLLRLYYRQSWSPFSEPHLPAVCPAWKPFCISLWLASLWILFLMKKVCWAVHCQDTNSRWPHPKSWCRRAGKADPLSNVEAVGCFTLAWFPLNTMFYNSLPLSWLLSFC